MMKTREAPLPLCKKQGELSKLKFKSLNYGEKSELNRSESEQEQGEEEEEEKESKTKAAGVNDGCGFLTTEIFHCVPFCSTQT